MATLYELTDEMMQLYELALGDVDEDVLKDTMEAVEGEFEYKAENYAKVIKQLEADAEMYEKEMKRLSERESTCKNRAKYLKQRLQYAMEQTDKLKFKTDLFSFNVRKNGGKAPLLIHEDAVVPEEYMKVVTSPDNDKIRAALEAGEILDFAELKERGQSLVIR